MATMLGLQNKETILTNWFGGGKARPLPRLLLRLPPFDVPGESPEEVQEMFQERVQEKVQNLSRKESRTAGLSESAEEVWETWKQFSVEY